MSAKCPTCSRTTDCRSCKSHLSGRAVAPVEEWQADHDARWHRDLEVGDGVTRHLVPDALPYVVVQMHGLGNIATVAHLQRPENPQRRDVDGPYPVIDHTYSSEERAAAVAAWREAGDDAPVGVKIRRRGDGRWYLPGDNRPVAVDGARYVRDYRD